MNRWSPTLAKHQVGFSDKAPWSQLFPAEQARIILLLVRRVTVTAAGLKVDIRREMVAPRRLEAAE